MSGQQESAGQTGVEHGAKHLHGARPHAESGEDEVTPSEPQTPMWLPLVGAALFLLGFLFFALKGTSKVEERMEGGSPEAAATAAEGAPEGADTQPSP